MDQTHSALIAAVNDYQTPPAAQQALSANPPLVVAGTSGSGKTASIQYIAEHGPYQHVVSHTTRAKRDNEVNGVNMWFVSDSEMLELIKNQAFIEVKAIHGHTVYGTSIDAYKKAAEGGKTPVMDIDVQGIAEIIKYVPHLKPVFILPPNFETWMERLQNRGQMSHVELQRRLHSAILELEAAMRNEHFMLVVNHDIPQTAKEIQDGRTDSFTQRDNRELAQRLIEHVRVY